MLSSRTAPAQNARFCLLQQEDGDSLFQMMVEKGTRLQQRRSERVLAHLPVLVEGHVKEKGPFTEPTRAILLNAHGALITLVARTELGEKLMLTNVATLEEQECRVVYLGGKLGGGTEVGIAFKHPAPKFWGIATPPPDWKPFLD